MDILYLEDTPSQTFDLRIGQITYTTRFTYNQLADRWSFTIWPEGVDCPLLAGTFLEVGRDLIETLQLGHKLMVLDRAGVDTEQNWYDRVTLEIGPDFTATYLVLGTDAEFEALFEDNDPALQPFC